MVSVCSKRSDLLRTVKNYTEDVEKCDASQTGIKTLAVWNKIQSFHATDNFAFDVMHDL